MLSLNLLPDIKKDLLHIQRQRNAVIFISIISVAISVGILLIMLSTWGGITIVQNTRRGDIETATKKIKKAQANQQLDNYLTIQNQLKQVNSLKQEQQVYSRLMKYLAQLNPAEPNNVQLQTVVINVVSGVANIRVEGKVKNFSALNIYKNTLEKSNLKYETDNKLKSGSTSKSSTANVAKAKTVPLFDSVAILQSSISDEAVSFVASMKFNKLAFSPKIKDPTIEVPVETTSDGDQKAPKVTFSSDNKKKSDQKGVGTTSESTFNSTSIGGSNE